MKRLLSLLIVVALLLPFMGVLGSETSKSETAAQYLIKKGIMSGYYDGSLGLDKMITRAEFTKMIVLTASIKVNTGGTFRDVSRDYWAYDYISTAAKKGIIGGFEDKTFRPDKNVTYEQAVKMVMLAFDFDNLSYPLEYITTAVDNGYLDGIPAIIGNNATRGDIALLLYNALMIKNEDAKIQKLEEEYTKAAESKNTKSSSDSNAISSGNTCASPAAPSPSSAQAGGSVIICGIAPTIYGFNTEEYNQEDENIFKNARTSPLSTFSIDVDTASYSNMRRFILNGQFPTAGSIRTEELINYFDYTYPLPTDGTPFSVTTEVHACPWNSEHYLALIALKGDEIPQAERKPSNLVFLLDVSGSMFAYNKLPLVKRAAAMLVEQLNEEDTVSIVTYAGSTEVVLDSVRGSDKEKILNAIYGLNANGCTAGASGINLAYDIASKNKINGNNRIILCTDGDFNVGISSTSELEKLIEDKRDMGIFLSVLGFGMGNYKDNRMETLADKGNGNYAYIDNLREAKKVLVDDMMKTLYTIAKDVKIQVEFNPQAVKEYRLIGYENRKLDDEDFENDKKDAGELGAGHTVTALYEIIPGDGKDSSGLRYQTNIDKQSSELMYVKLRYKNPNEEISKLIEKPVNLDDSTELTGENFRFASAVAQFGMILNNSEFKGNSTYGGIIEQAQNSMGKDLFGLRAEFIQLVGIAKYIINNH